MTFKHLLAKSCANPDEPPEAATLVGHTKAVLEAFRAMFGLDAVAPTRLSRRWLGFFKLPEDAFPIFWKNTILACLFHDLGKANSGFQEMVRKRPGQQLLRHEHLSGIFLSCKELRDWCEAIPGADRRIVISAVACHHLKTAPRNQKFAESTTDRQRFAVYPPAVLTTLHEAVTQFPDLPPLPQALSIPDRWNLESPVSGGSLKEETKSTLMDFRRALADKRLLHLLLAVRAALIAADSAGSGLVREGKEIKAWLDEAFADDPPLTDQKITSEIIEPRITAIEAKNAKPFTWQKFQTEAGHLPDRALLVSACGSGKTLAAWRWITTRLAARPAARAIFLYPTKATASEGFKDYVSWAPEGMLLHSSSRYDLQGMFDSPEDDRESSRFLVEDRLFALAYWHRKIFSATVHQFLGFMQNSYRSICLLPLLADSVVVIDEVHSFDPALFSALKQFLGNFDIPVLCMTATLPQARQQDLVGLGLQFFPRDSADFADLYRETSAKRYEVRLLPDGGSEAETLASEARAAGKKVLWVVNTVDRCQNLAKKLDALCYHSRFKLDDRNARHREIISAFKGNESLLAITTQVCEMSLDLDADVLITEIAPITSLIQRMGRCNRHRKRETGQVYLYRPDDSKPYSDEDLAGTDEFVAALDGHKISQVDLENLLERFGNNAKEAERYSAFLGDTAWAESREKMLTDIKETSVQAILGGDLFEFLSLRRNRMPTDGLLVPVPRYPPDLTRSDSRLGRFPLLAPDDHYDKRFGFTRAPLEIIV
ncbi:MAG: CRISPR-associated helicase Cas3' [Thermodesulfobacteriota bacterium]